MSRMCKSSAFAGFYAPCSTNKPDYPMQQVCWDFAHFKNRSYVILVDRFTNWTSEYQATKAEGLIHALRYHFVNFGAPEELASDGGPEYMAAKTQELLQR